ncbi:hypothetical protein GCM10028805_60580 [Spirosoma harenae]
MQPITLFVIALFIAAMAFIYACTPIKKGPNIAVDTQGGYKNLKLDATYDSLQKLVELKPAPDNPCIAIKKFAISSEPYKTISSISLDTVELEFVNDRLYRVMLHTRYEYPVSGKLHKILRSEYGEPIEERKAEAGIKYVTYKWIGDKTYIHLIQRDHADLNIEYGSFEGKERSIVELKKCQERMLGKNDQ